MSGNPLLRLTRDRDKGFKVIETERSAIAPPPGLILAVRQKKLEELFLIRTRSLPTQLMYCLRRSIRGEKVFGDGSP